MALNIEDKKQIVADVSEYAKKALSAVCADSCGIPVAQMTKLRKAARDNNVYLHVVRNTLLARAVEGTEFECMQNDKFSIKALAFEGVVYEGKDVDVLATLPTYEEGVAQLMATMKEAAAGKLVRTLAALGDKLQGEAA